MGPIIGAGFGLGIYDFNLLKRSLNNLLIALVGLFVSTLYFYISPLKTHSLSYYRELHPIFMISLSFFLRFVGAIAITRVEKGNPPGVAIATALMLLFVLQDMA
jgi:uncharacterized membrane protein